MAGGTSPRSEAILPRIAVTRIPWRAVAAATRRHSCHLRGSMAQRPFGMAGPLGMAAPCNGFAAGRAPPRAAGGPVPASARTWCVA